MKKIYLVDSENVGDIWVPLLAASQPEDEVIVFYTQKSPHMNYENVRMLKETDKEANFIKCFEGSNALDFQLVSELGYRLRENQECDYVIVSNDTGFDAVVRYWSLRQMSVRRLSGKECYRQLNGKKKGTDESARTVQETQEPAAVQEMTATDTKEQGEKGIEEGAGVVMQQPDGVESQPAAGQQPDAATEESQAAGQQPDAAAGESQAAGQPEDAEKPSDMQPAMDADALVKTLTCCISKENLVDFHNALVALLGEDEGKKLYQEIKGNAEYTLYWSTLPAGSQKEKFELYCGLVFAHSEFAEEAPEDFAGFLYQASGKRKNLNSLRAALQGHYGKDKGMRYYSLFKSHIKIMNRM